MVGIGKITPVRVIRPLKVDRKDKDKKESTAIRETGVKGQVKGDDQDQPVKRIDERI